MAPRQRLLNALRGRAVDRKPVIIPGGMMAGSLCSLLKQGNFSYPDLHTHAETMAGYAVLLQETCGLDNVGVPFCMTIEAEDFGAAVDLGDFLREPRITGYPAATLNEVLALNPSPCPRHLAVLEAIAGLARGRVPVVGNIIGPASLITSLVEPGIAYRAMAKDRSRMARALNLISRHIIQFATEQIEAGADMIVLADPGASGEIIGGENFRHMVAPALDMIIRAVREKDIPIVLHICGDIMPLIGELAAIPWDALSVDSVVSLKRLKAHFPERALMGNISTHLLAISGDKRIYRAAGQAAKISDILAPACGLPTTTLPKNIRSMVRAARDASCNPVMRSE